MWGFKLIILSICKHEVWKNEVRKIARNSQFSMVLLSPSGYICKIFKRF